MFDFLRHGLTLDAAPGVLRGRQDDALTPTGWAQMHKSTAAGHWQAVVSSPLQRCHAFARQLARQRALPLQVDTRLVELDFGAWEGCAIEALLKQPEQAARLQAFWDDPWQNPPPQGETLVQFQTRVWAAWLELVHTYRGQRLLVVTHGGVIRLLRCLLEERPREDMLMLDIPHGSLHHLNPD